MSTRPSFLPLPPPKPPRGPSAVLTFALMALASFVLTVVQATAVMALLWIGDLDVLSWIQIYVLIVVVRLVTSRTEIRVR